MKQVWKRRLAYGGNASLVTAMVIGVLVLLFLLADSYRFRIDLSAESLNTLQTDTEAKLRLLDAEGVQVEVVAFTNQRGKDDTYFKDRAIKDLLTEIDARSNAVTWRQVDFDRERLTAERLGVSDYGRIVVMRGEDRVDIKDRELFRRVGKGGSRALEFKGEAALSRAFAQLLTPTRRVVYVLQGHGEPDPGDRSPEGLSELVSSLDIERYDVEALQLAQTDREGRPPAVPEDAAMVVVAGPRGPLTTQEEDILLDYLGGGGAMLLAVDLGDTVPRFLYRMGLRVPEGLAMDTRLVFPYRDRPVPVFKRHPVTEGLLESGQIVVLGAPAPLSLADPPPEGARATPVLMTGRDGWIERGGDTDGGTPIYQPVIDGEGPVVMAAAVQLLPGRGIVRSSKPSARVFVVGDSEWLTNALLLEGPGNRDMALNTVHWLAGDDQRLGVTVGRQTAERRLALTKEETGRLRAISLLLLPGVVVLLGLGTWYGRRGR